MKILVTGGAGFIGSHIVDQYIALGHEVVVIDNLSTGQRKYVNLKASFYQLDIRDKTAITRLFEKEKPELLNHLAAQMDVRKSVADPEFDADVNILGFLRLLEAGRINGLKHVIFASSGGAIYGDAQEIPTSENFPPRPASPYGVSKLSGEYYLNFYFQEYGITFCALRYGNVYGPRQNPHGEAGVIAIFCKKLLANEQPIINGDGLQTRDFVFVEDVVAANIAALEKRQVLICNIGTGNETSINEIFKLLAELTGKKLSMIYGPAKSGEQRRSVLSNKYAYKALSWKPRFTLEAGLEKTVQFFTHET